VVHYFIIEGIAEVQERHYARLRGCAEQQHAQAPGQAGQRPLTSQLPGVYLHAICERLACF